jgi:hypothetical protein
LVIGHWQLVIDRRKWEMNARDGCGRLALGCLFGLVALAVFAALAAALVLTGEAPLYAPRLTGFEPHPNDAYLPTTAITLTFDQPMDPASVQASFALVPGVAGTFHWNERRTEFTFVPDPPGYEPGRTYRVRLAPDVKAGTLPRTTAQGTEWDIVLPPLLDAQTPPSGQADMEARPLLQATFNYALDCDLTAQTFTVRPPAAGAVECLDRALTFRPTQPLAPDTAYTVTFTHVFLKDDPSLRPGVSWQLTTAPALTLVAASPGEGDLLTDLWTPVRITFNRPVLADSAVSRFSLATNDGSAVPGRVSWQDGGATLVFTPDQPLQPATGYKLALQPGVEDELGFSWAGTLSRFFTTADMLALPQPAPDSHDVHLDSTIRIPFTRPMDRASVEAGLTISPPLAGDVVWEDNTLAWTPKHSLVADTRYEVVLGANVRDASGAPLAEDRRWTFATEPFLLGAKLPAGRVLMQLQQPITFTFALPMDRASTRAALAISPTTPGDLTWSDDGRTATFQPDPAWLAGADYEIILSASARTADGAQKLGQDLSWTFTTGVAQIQFGEGPNVQVMDTAGERLFQMIAQGADVADFELYAITPTQFLDLYSSGFRGIGPQDSRIVDTAGLTPTLLWREPLHSLEGQTYGTWRFVEAHVPADVPPGMYVLASAAPAVETEDGQENNHLLVVLTRHALVLKRALAGSSSRTQAQIVAWDTALSGGAPVVSATVRFYDRDGTFLAEGLTGADGLLSLDVPGDPGPLLALSTSPPQAGGTEGGQPDVTPCGFGNEWSQSGWWGWWSQPASRPLYTTYSYTDRPIYRPGQTVYFKDFVRAAADVSFTLPAPPASPPPAGGTEGGLPVTVRLRDARDNVAATQVLTPTAFGTVHGAFQLADEPMLGTWNLETEVEGTVTHQPLKVEEYRKPEYEVTVGTPQKACVAGETISVTVDAAYYFDQPVGGAGVELVVYPTYADENSYNGAGGPAFGYPISTQRGRLDAQGHWEVRLATDEVFGYQPHSRRAVLALEATVTDEAGRGVSSYQTVVVQRTSQGLSLLLERHGYQPGDEIALGAIVLDREGEPVAGTDLTAQLLGWDERVVISATMTTDTGGQALFPFRVTEQGWYHLAVRGTDDGGREMLAEDWLWVYDPSGQAPWYQGRWGEKPILSVSADRTTYAVGDVAQLLVYAAAPGPALLTFERGETHGSRPVTLISGTNLITLPIRADFAPNIYVNVSQFGPLTTEEWWSEQSRPEAGLHTASAQLLVPMADRLLTVTLTADQETYSPGDEATFHVQVTDHTGRPVVAEVSLAVVDEAIYALAEDMSKDPFDVFYAPRPDLVSTFDSLRPVRWLYAQGGMGGGDGEAGGAPRRNFLDTAYWAPAVVTGEDGRATVTFTLPDNLTEWRALARAVTTDTLVGQATAQVVVSQDIVVRPALPRFLVQGDAITLTAVVHNYTTGAVSATVDLELSNLKSPISNLQQVVQVPAGGSATVGWPVVAEQPGEARVTVRATAGVGARIAGRDAAELSFPILPLAVPEIATFAGDLTPSRPTDTITVTLPSDAIGSESSAEGLSRLEINLAPSIAPGLLDGLEYLIDYPFG